MLRQASALVVLSILTALASAPVVNALPGWCGGRISLDCDVPHDPCDVLDDLCGGIPCVQNARPCIIDPIKSCGYNGESCILP